MTILAKVFPLEISQGSDGGPLFDTRITRTRAGYERRNKNWDQYQYQANVYQAVSDQTDYETLYSFFLEVGGMAYGFLFTNPGDYKSCKVNETVAFDDLDLGNGDGTTATFQLQKTYGTARTETKTITRPKSGTVKIGIGGTEYTGGWSVATTTGKVTFDNVSGSVTNAEDLGGGITRITVSGSNMAAGKNVYLSGFTGDWAGLNAARYVVVSNIDSNRFTISFDSSAYAVYSANGGQMDTLPQAGEALTAGFEYYLPVRFNTDFMRSTYANFQSYDTELSVIEIKE